MEYNYQELIQDDPIIQNLLVERELKRETQGRAEGKIEGLQEAVSNFLHIRFPVLAATSQV